MSTDSTELTFVRCPSCGSLVPAMSARCRMCGTGLDASAEQEEGEDSSSGRVRQRTTSTQVNPDLAAATEQIREESEASVQASPALTEEQEVEDTSEREEDVRSDEIVSESPEEEVLEASTESETSVDEELDPLSAYVEEVEVASPEAVEEIEEPAPTEEPAVSAAMEVPSEVAEAPAELEEEQEVLDAQEEPESFVPPEETVVNGNGDHSATEELEASEEETPVEEDSEESEALPETEPVESEEVLQSVADDESAEQVEAKGLDKQEETMYKEEDISPSAKESAEEAPAPAGVIPRKDTSNTLIGWFVSYSDPSGEAVELRQGKFFVTQTSLKDSDLCIEHESVATPHAMIAVSPEAGLRIQDLMSERGVFVRRKGTDTYKREEDAVRVDNGDWVRFGDVEFLVALIPHVGTTAPGA